MSKNFDRFGAPEICKSLHKIIIYLVQSQLFIVGFNDGLKIKLLFGKIIFSEYFFDMRNIFLK